MKASKSGLMNLVFRTSFDYDGAAYNQTGAGITYSTIQFFQSVDGGGSSRWEFYDAGTVRSSSNAQPATWVLLWAKSWTSKIPTPTVSNLKSAFFFVQKDHTLYYRAYSQGVATAKGEVAATASGYFYVWATNNQSEPFSIKIY